ncbi:type II toxin-antitoxin system PemK/MazF family toxin [Mycetocola tolaasinivorans]|uniref:Type II toxin-antitoxin system PemK/MazF family toxin n=1 Tax=Mycetocola tolaasinivorans TaxID=76635 RepID=A0A3L7AA88_9MICO|nr:type II toxin-antitoxin system PemK/MazF family toxin [Mycetocola tolaasinivorans]RLP76985.1 type II toxin-antitoxin system PemK/MazF family toxin [Mycetocola tolaasinivorans]
MNTFLRILREILSVLSGPSKPGQPTRPGAGKPGASKPGGGSRPGTEAPSPGQTGPQATREVDAHRVGNVTMTYAPNRDGDADPGEIVWTWVPFEENDGRGKDRPVLVVATLGGGDVLAIQLTSKAHSGQSDFVPIGAGPWDSQGRPSWANLDRVFRLKPGGMRREASSLDHKNFNVVASALRKRYGWR